MEETGPAKLNIERFEKRKKRNEKVRNFELSSH